MPTSTKVKRAESSKRVGSKQQAHSAKDTPWKLRSANGLQVLQSPNLSRLDWLVHGFSTRPGGASEMQAVAPGRKPAERVLNLGFTDWDSREHVLANREKFFRAVGASKARPITLRQIHSDLACGVSSSMQSATAEEPAKADALFTREPGVLLIVQTADCVPILLADTKQRAVAAIHSGWRGTVQRIAQKTLGRMQMEFGTRPRDVVAAIGPCIAQSCYEVGSDVTKQFHAQFANAREWFDGPFDALASGENDPNWLPWLTMRPPGHPPPPPTVQLDLVAANRAILVEAGIPAANISASGFCTACRLDLFFSYRRERTTGRMMAAIAIR
ncbi:MAG TPA: peptidoglycan editing factor PgeF [Candidatus Acidoferrales bacterium]|nr:peptidoglycan editing factor PgeF [Candidatus Acidoferrales bacterium]